MVNVKILPAFLSLYVHRFLHLCLRDFSLSVYLYFCESVLLSLESLSPVVLFFFASFYAA